MLPLEAPRISARLSQDAGWCEMVGQDNNAGYIYNLLYPKEWTVGQMGANLPNLAFSPNPQQRLVFLYVATVSNELSIEQADQSILACTPDKCYPAVEPDETIIKRAIETIESKQVLALITNKEDTTITRYFVLLSPWANKKGFSSFEKQVYVFEFAVPKSNYEDSEYLELSKIVQKMVASLKPNSQ